MMFLAKELGKSLEEVLEISTLEFRMWAAYYKVEGQKRQQSMKKQGRRRG